MLLLTYINHNLYNINIYPLPGGGGNRPPSTIKSANSLRNGKVAPVWLIAKFISAVANSCSMFIISSGVGL